MTGTELITRWIAQWHPDFRAEMVVRYAAWLECPVAEIDPDFADVIDREWLWTNFLSVIQLFAEDIGIRPY